MQREQFTPEEIDQWRDFEVVRSSGMYNMYDPRAREATGLTSDQYLFVMKNFSNLKKQATE